MRILLTGATGFIGRHIARELQTQGHTVLAAGRRSQPPLDYRRATQPAAWAPWLQDPATRPDAVVNAVGVLRDSRAQPMQALHTDAPVALFDACAQAGVRRVVQISALGIEANPTAYARTKRAADAQLLALTAAGTLDGVVLRPSIVFGRQGQSSRLFLALARLPVLALPRPVQTAQVQPLAVGDLARAVAALLGRRTDTGLLNLAGPQPLTLAAFIASLRQQMGHAPAPTLTLPDWLTQASARAGDWVPVAPWCSETLALLAADNVAPPDALQTLLTRPATAPQDLLAQAT